MHINQGRFTGYLKGNYVHHVKPARGAPCFELIGIHKGKLAQDVTVRNQNIFVRQEFLCFVYMPPFDINPPSIHPPMDGCRCCRLRGVFHESSTQFFKMFSQNDSSFENNESSLRCYHSCHSISYIRPLFEDSSRQYFVDLTHKLDHSKYIRFAFICTEWAKER